MSTALIKAQKSLNIRTVYLRSNQVVINDDLDPLCFGDKESTTQGFHNVTGVIENTISTGDENNIWEYKFNVAIGLRSITDGDEDVSLEDPDYKPLLEIVANFQARYESINQLSEDEIKAFSVDNVTFHVWPYWREFVQSSCSRIGLNPILDVPMYVLNGKE